MRVRHQGYNLPTLAEEALRDGLDIERATADELEVGDVFADAKTHPGVKLEVIESVGESSRWLQTSGGRIRPRHTKRVWRLVQP